MDEDRRKIHGTPTRCAKFWTFIFSVVILMGGGIGHLASAKIVNPPYMKVLARNKAENIDRIKIRLFDLESRVDNIEGKLFHKETEETNIENN